MRLAVDHHLDVLQRPVRLDAHREGDGQALADDVHEEDLAEYRFLGALGVHLQIRVVADLDLALENLAQLRDLRGRKLERLADGSDVVAKERARHLRFAEEELIREGGRGDDEKGGRLERPHASKSSSGSGAAMKSCHLCGPHIETSERTMMAAIPKASSAQPARSAQANAAAR